MSDSLRLLRAMNGIHEEDVRMAERSYYEKKNGRHIRAKRLASLLIAAVLLLSLGVTAFAISARVASPEAAERVALEQIEEWKRMGLLSTELRFEGPADEVFEFSEREGGSAWYGRIFRHHYDVRWFFNREGEPKYGCNLAVDTLSGKITMASLFAVPDRDEEPVEEVSFLGEDGKEQLWYYYDNFDDIVPADMTLDRFCTGLAEYWGFSGYRLEKGPGAKDPDSALDGNTLLCSLPDSYGSSYVKVFFEGDQEGTPMYLTVTRYPGHSCVMIGTGHAVG